MPSSTCAAGSSVEALRGAARPSAGCRPIRAGARTRRWWISPPARWGWAPSRPRSAPSPRAISPITAAWRSPRRFVAHARRRGARRGQRVGGPARGLARRARQSPVDRRHESPEPRPRHARRAAGQLRSLFAAAGWHVIELRWGSRLHATFARPGGERLRARLEAHVQRRVPRAAPPARGRGAQGASSPRATASPTPALDRFLADSSDETLQALVGDVGGHDLAAIIEAYAEAERHRDGPSVILADTIKGWGLPLAGDPHEPRRAARPSPARRAAGPARDRAGRRVGGLPGGQRRGGGDRARRPLFAPPAAPAAVARRSPIASTSPYPPQTLEPGGLRPRAGRARPPARRAIASSRSPPTWR